MIKFVFFLSVFMQLTAAFAREKSVFIVIVTDPLGDPVPNANIRLEGQKGVTDSLGACRFSKVKLKKKYDISIEGDRSKYLEWKNSVQLSGSTRRTFVLEWNAVYFGNLIFQLRSQTIEERKVVFENTDFSKYALCSDTTGDHYFMEAAFPGGQRMMQYFISSYIEYPEASLDMEEQGKVYLSFVVEGDGSLSTIMIEKGVSQALDREAKRLIKSMPSWSPAYCNGEPVRIKVRLPLVFTLE